MLLEKLSYLLYDLLKLTCHILSENVSYIHTRSYFLLVEAYLTYSFDLLYDLSKLTCHILSENVSYLFSPC